jgi:hypothetical protein
MCLCLCFLVGDINTHWHVALQVETFKWSIAYPPPRARYTHGQESAQSPGVAYRYVGCASIPYLFITTD